MLRSTRSVLSHSPLVGIMSNEPSFHWHFYAGPYDGTYMKRDNPPPLEWHFPSLPKASLIEIEYPLVTVLESSEYVYYLARIADSIALYWYSKATVPTWAEIHYVMNLICSGKV